MERTAAVQSSHRYAISDNLSVCAFSRVFGVSTGVGLPVDIGFRARQPYHDKGTGFVGKVNHIARRVTSWFPA